MKRLWNADVGKLFKKIMVFPNVVESNIEKHEWVFTNYNIELKSNNNICHPNSKFCLCHKNRQVHSNDSTKQKCLRLLKWFVKHL